MERFQREGRERGTKHLAGAIGEIMGLVDQHEGSARVLVEEPKAGPRVEEVVKISDDDIGPGCEVMSEGVGAERVELAVVMQGFAGEDGQAGELSEGGGSTAVIVLSERAGLGLTRFGVDTASS